MMFHSLSILVLDGELARAEVSDFLKSCFSDLEREKPNHAWSGWAEAVATLALQDLAPLVREVFAADLIEPFSMTSEDFDRGLAYALTHPEAPAEYWHAELHAFGDTVEELSEYYLFKEAMGNILARMIARGYESDAGWMEERGADARKEQLDYIVEDPVTPFVNPSRDIGRNDPCPCGSGKKYKKCCLN
jgi:uncharacterized protein